MPDSVVDPSFCLLRRTVAVLVVALLAAACAGGADEAGTEPPTSAIEATAPADPASAEAPTSRATETADGEPTTPEEAAAGEDAPEPATTSTPEAPPTSTPDPAELTVEIPTGLRLELTPLLSVSQPIALATRARSDNVYLATKGGRIVELAIDGDQAQIVADVADLSSRVSGGSEQGLLGLVFSPDGDRLFVNLTDRSGDTRIIAWRMDGSSIDPDSEQILLTVNQPAGNHNGGDLTFGPDGHLYIGLGDGGGAGDPFRTGQDPFSLLATIVRIAPTDTGYEIPGDNPFVDGNAGAPETFIWGARNPWRFSFDRLTGDLWIADVGQDNLEEVNVLYANTTTPGTNLGWPDVEGNAPFAAAGPPTDNYTAPIYTYGRTDGCSVTGGYIYRGTNIPQLQGHYIFGDYCTSDLWALATSQTQGFIDRWDLGLRVNENTLASFGQGPDGELYVLALDGTLFRIDPA